jgi:hypothetical protein
LAAVLACQQPAADVLAVWVDASVDEDGARAIQIYDAGERRQVELHPTIADSDTSRIALGVSPRGSGFAVSSFKGGTVWVDVTRGTRAVLGVGPWGELGEEAVFSRSGRSLLRNLADSGYDVVLLPIASRHATPLWLRSPETEHVGAEGLVRSASDAPIVYWVELGTSGGGAVDGTIAAYAYPADDSRTDVDELVLLGRGQMHTRAIGLDSYPGRIGSTWCSSSFCVTPTGDALIGISSTALCQLLRFEWARVGSDGESRPPRIVDLPLGCGWDNNEPHLIAALDASHVVLDDDDRIYLADLDAGVWTATPKLGGVTQISMLPADGGRVMNFVSGNGTLVRVDADSIDVVSAERTDCQEADQIVTSPGGGWVVMTCRGTSDAIDELGIGDIGTTLRISALGLERFDGLAMRALAVDDGGNALMYSYDPDDNDGVPRGLFVLEGDGRLSRVDELEPTPQAFGSATAARYFSAAPH